MAFINNKKFAEIRTAAKDGNEKALMILQAMRKLQPQADIDRLVEDYYAIPEEPQIQPVQDENYNVAEEQPKEEVSTVSDTLDDVLSEDLSINETTDIPDLDADVHSFNLDDITKDMDGLIDEDEIDDMSFADFLSDKKKNLKRAKKNADYFKMYDDDSRKQYSLNAVDKYKAKFGDLERDIDRRNKDTATALGLYEQSVADSLDDDIELNVDNADKAYSDLTDDSGAMHAFGRYWDDDDKANIIEALKGLIGKYGKKNVLAAINTLKSDNENYKSYMHNRIDTEVGKYSKNLENLLGK
nr:MAG TPA: hypothetical protein [Bacteriophage sp.]